MLWGEYIKKECGGLVFKKILKIPSGKQHAKILRKEMKKGKIFLYDEEIIGLLENQPMNYFQTAADFLLLKNILGRPAQHIATNVMALTLEGHVKKMHLVEADLNPDYPDLLENGTKLENERRAYLEVVFLNDEEEPEEITTGITKTERYFKDIRTEQWYVIDANLGLIFEKNLYLKLEKPRVRSSLSGDLLQSVIDDTRELIRPGLDCGAEQILTIMNGLEQLNKTCPKYRYQDILLRRMLRLQMNYVRKVISTHH